MNLSCGATILIMPAAFVTGNVSAPGMIPAAGKIATIRYNVGGFPCSSMSHRDMPTDKQGINCSNSQKEVTNG